MSPCIEVVGWRDRQGYGQITYNGRRWKEHRLAYALAHDLSMEDLYGRLVRHTCDNPSCRNPEHLVLGSNKDNSQDMVDRGRSTRGSKHPNAKLTERDVQIIRDEYKFRDKEFGGRALAARFNVTPMTISDIINNRRWSYNGPDLT